MQLHMADGTPMKAYRPKMMQLDLGLWGDFKWVFLVADVTKPILGGNFFAHFGLVSNIRRQILENRSMGLVTHCAWTDNNYLSGSLAYVGSNDELTCLLAKYPGIVGVEAKHPASLRWSTKHHIEIRGAPVSAKARRLNPQKLWEAQLAFQAILERGDICPGKG